ncbi:MAG: 2Fe-2S iron-sulfur cluster-binding protein [Nitrospirales bacterium]
MKCIPVAREPHHSTDRPGGRSADRPMAFAVRFVPENRVVPAAAGQSLLDVCEAHAIALDHRCGGACSCSSCLVLVHEGLAHLSPAEEDEADQLADLEEAPPAARLGCQARVHGDVVVEIPRDAGPRRAR